MEEFIFDLQRFDTISNSTDNTTVNGTNDDDYIANGGNTVTINGGAGDDSIFNGGNTVTINGGAGDDSIVNDSESVTISGGDENDYIENEGDNVSIDGGDGNDYIGSDGSNVTLNGGAGDDTVENFGDTVTINGGAGDDKILNFGSNVTIDGGDGKDIIQSSGDNVSINGGAGDDIIENAGENVTINTSDGDDMILADANVKSFTVTGFGTGDAIQFIKTEEEEEFIPLTITSLGSADGSLLAVVDDNGTEATVTIGGIAFADAAIGSDDESIVFSSGNDDGDGGGDGDEDNNGIDFNNKKNTPKSTSATITSAFEGDTFDANDYRKLTTIKTSKKLTSDIEIIGNNKSNTITSGSGDDTIDGGRGANKIDGGAGDDSLYGGGIGNDTLTGGKGADIFVYDGKGHDVITDYTAGEDTLQVVGTVRKASVSGSNVIFKVGSSDLTLNKAVGKKITYIDENNTEITEIYRAEGRYDEDETELKIFSTFEGSFTAGKTLETIDGSNVKFQSMKLVGNDRDNSIIGGNKDDILNGGAGSDTLDGGNGADSIFGGDGDDLLLGGNGGDTLRGGTGNDTLIGGTGKNIFVYESGDDVITDFSESNSNRIQLLNDTITTNYEISGNDLIFDFSGGSLTVKDYDGREIKFLDAKNNETSYVFTENALLNSSKTHATVISSSYTAEDKISQIDGSKVDGANIIGNSRSNIIFDSSGNDTLTGGDGNDWFIFSGGNDIITDYTSGDDKIMLLRGSITPDNFTVRNNELILDFDNGSLTIQNYNGDRIRFFDADGNEKSYCFTENALLNGSKTIATLVSGNSYTADAKIIGIDASNLVGKATITGNGKSNVIYANDSGNTLIGGGGNDYLFGGKGNDLISGGDGADFIDGGDGTNILQGDKGNDTLWGGNGADMFVINSGDGNDVIYNFNYNELDMINYNGKDITDNIYRVYTSNGKPSNFSVNLSSTECVTFMNFK